MQGLQITFNNVSIQDKQYLIDYWTNHFELETYNKNLWEIRDNNSNYLVITMYEGLLWSIPLSAFRFGFEDDFYTIKVDSLTLHTFAKGVAQRSYYGSYITFDFVVAKIKSWFN